MKKIITFLFSVGLVSAVFAQTGDRSRNDSRDSRGGNPPSYPMNDQSGYSNQYSNDDQYNRNSQWDGRGSNNSFARNRQRLARQRYEMMMMRRNQERYNRQRRYVDYSPYGQSRGPVLQIRIGGGQRRY